MSDNTEETALPTAAVGSSFVKVQASDPLQSPVTDWSLVLHGDSPNFLSQISNPCTTKSTAKTQQSLNSTSDLIMALEALNINEDDNEEVFLSCVENLEMSLEEAANENQNLITSEKTLNSENLIKFQQQKTNHADTKRQATLTPFNDINILNESILNESAIVTNHLCDTKDDLLSEKYENISLDENETEAATQELTYIQNNTFNKSFENNHILVENTFTLSEKVFITEEINSEVTELEEIIGNRLEVANQTVVISEHLNSTEVIKSEEIDIQHHHQNASLQIKTSDSFENSINKNVIQTFENESLSNVDNKKVHLDEVVKSGEIQHQEHTFELIHNSNENLVNKNYTQIFEPEQNLTNDDNTEVVTSPAKEKSFISDNNTTFNNEDYINVNNTITISSSNKTMSEQINSTSEIIEVEEINMEGDFQDHLNTTEVNSLYYRMENNYSMETSTNISNITQSMDTSIFKEEHNLMAPNTTFDAKDKINPINVTFSEVINEKHQDPGNTSHIIVLNSSCESNYNSVENLINKNNLSQYEQIIDNNIKRKSSPCNDNSSRILIPDSTIDIEDNVITKDDSVIIIENNVERNSSSEAGEITSAESVKLEEKKSISYCHSVENEHVDKLLLEEIKSPFHLQSLENLKSEENEIMSYSQSVENEHVDYLILEEIKSPSHLQSLENLKSEENEIMSHSQSVEMEHVDKLVPEEVKSSHIQSFENGDFDKSVSSKTDEDDNKEIDNEIDTPRHGVIIVTEQLNNSLEKTTESVNDIKDDKQEEEFEIMHKNMNTLRKSIGSPFIHYKSLLESSPSVFAEKVSKYEKQTDLLLKINQLQQTIAKLEMKIKQKESALLKCQMDKITIVQKYTDKNSSELDLKVYKKDLEEIYLKNTELEDKYKKDTEYLKNKILELEKELKKKEVANLEMMLEIQRITEEKEKEKDGFCHSLQQSDKVIGNLVNKLKDLQNQIVFVEGTKEQVKLALKQICEKYELSKLVVRDLREKESVNQKYVNELETKLEKFEFFKSKAIQQIEEANKENCKLQAKLQELLRAKTRNPRGKK